MSNLLYNGVSLPTTPAHDASYGVEVIVKVLPSGQSIYGGAEYILAIGKRTLWQNGKCYVSGIYAVYRLSGDAWVWHYGSGTVSTQDIVAANYFEALWTNTNIPTADGSGIYLAATAPVDPNAPEEPDEPVEPDEPEEPETPTVTKTELRRAFFNGFILGAQIRGMLKKRVVEKPDEPVVPVPTDYLTFASNSPFTIAAYDSTKTWDGALYYSTDADTWNEWDGAAAIASAEHDEEQRLYMRGVGNSVITGYILSMVVNRYWIISGTEVRCIGNIENLLDYETVKNGEHPAMGTGCFRHLFYKCAALTTAPELPATTLAERCYDTMFIDCSSLTKAPELPATTLTNYCYNSMFRRCTSLVAPPELPATSLAKNCYAYMFQECSALAAAPKLPATTLAEYCYNTMFSSCTSLTAAPELPATTLASRCYAMMFYKCSSLMTIPKLPATTLAERCYSQMFDSCTKVKLSETQTGEYQTAYRIPTSGTGVTASSAMFEMFDLTGGTFTGEPSLNTTYYTSNQVI